MVTLGLALLLQAAPQGPLPEVVTRSRVDHGRGVDFHAVVVPETVYVGQQATYQLGVFLDQDTRQRIRRNPEFQPAETRSLLTYELRERGGGSVSGNLDGRPYEIHVFRRALFALTPGRYAIPQARLTYALPQSSSFFSREESYTLRSEAVNFVAIEPPTAGRPADWAGAVGSWHAAARVDTARGRAGEPFVFTLRVEGQGNVTLLPRPSISIPWASVVKADERVNLDSTPSLLGGWKEFDWLVTPIAPGLHRVPPVRYAYFNPRTRRYESAETGTVDVRVATGDASAPVVAAEPTRAEPPLALRATLDRPAWPPLSRNPVTWVLLAIAPLAGLSAWFARRPRRVRPPLTPRQRLDVVGDRGDADAVREVRRALVDGLRMRTGLDASRLTAPGEWARGLRKAGVGAEAAAAVEALLGALDAACFAPEPVRQPAGAGWGAQAREALRIVDDEALGARVGGGARAVAVTALAILAMLGPSHARAQGEAASSFASGMTAYSGSDFVRAERHFADAAQADPRSASAWANFGTAAFMAHDTASAVVGWQRALRLDPTDQTIRDRLARIRAPQDVGAARVVPIPASVLTLLALLTWIAAWALTARQAWRRRPLRRLVLATILGGGALVVAAYLQESSLEGRGLAVVTSPVPLRTLPALGAETGSTPLPGEVAHLDARQGAWAHIRLDGGREGWVPLERITPLGHD